jgi:hypothetical protein
LSPSFFGQVDEPQSSSLFRRIHPRNFAPRFDALSQIERKPKMDRSVPENRRKRIKTETCFGNIQDRAAVVPLQLNKGKFVEYFPDFPATIEVHVR